MKSFLIGVALAGTFLIGALAGSIYEDKKSWAAGRYVVGDSYYIGGDQRGWSRAQLAEAEIFQKMVENEVNLLKQKNNFPAHLHEIKLGVNKATKKPTILILHPVVVYGIGSTYEILASFEVAELTLDEVRAAAKIAYYGIRDNKKY